MKRQFKRRSNEGSALVLAVCITATVGLMGASLLAFADYQIGAMERARQDNVAMAVAEAGANAAFAVLKTNFANKDNSALFPATAYNGGTYDVTVTSVEDDKAQIKSVGISGTSTQTVIVDVRDFSTGTEGSGGGEGSGPDTTTPWGHAVFVNGSITHNGAGTAFGNVRCNATMTCNGSLNWGSATNPVAIACKTKFSANGSITIRGSVTAPTISINGSKSIDQQIIATPPTIAFPTLDLTPFYNVAVANNQVYAGTSYNGSQTWGTIPGGVRWYNGNFSANGSTTFSGCIIATGSISFNGGVTQTQVNQLPAFVSRDSTVTCNGSHTVNGLVYSKGNLTWNGAGSLNGGILCGGSLTFNGSYGNIYWSNYIPSTNTTSGGTGGGEGTTAPQVGVTAWQK